MEFKKLNAEHIRIYRNSVLKTSSASTFDRKIFSLKKFFEWAVKEGYLDQSPVEEFLKQEQEAIKTKLGAIEKKSKVTPSYNSFQSRIIARLSSKPKLQKLAYHIFFYRPKWYKEYHSLPIASYFNYAILILLMSVMGFGAYNQFIKSPTTPLAYPTSLVRANRYLSFQGRLTNNLGTPITTSTDLVFKLYDADSGGSTLWDSTTCAITPDQDGIFSVLLGSDCGSEIASSVFSENAGVWLGVKVGTDVEATPRIQIATVAYALNSETLQGYPASASATINTVPVMNNSGQIVLAASSPKIQSTSGNFALEGQSITIDTPSGSDGDITIAPDGAGVLNLTFAGAAPGGSAQGFVSATNANITSGSLYYGEVGSDATGYNLIELASGSFPRTKFAVDSAGNATLSGTINGLAISGGTISTGTWQGTLIGSQYGGTGANNSTAAQYAVPYYSATGVLGGALSPGSDGYVLTTHSTGSAPTWTDAASVGTNYWQLNSHVLAPANAADYDLAVGGNSTSSAKFLVNAATGNITGSGTASISGNLTLGNGSAIQSAYGPVTLNYKSGADAYTAGLTLTNSGYVGIGTGTPGYNLDVNGTTRATTYRLTAGGYWDAGTLSFPTVGAGYYRIMTASQPLVFWTSGSETARLDGSGNLGINTTSPTAKLDVAGTASASGSLTFRAGGGEIQATKMEHLTLGGSTTGGVDFGSPITSGTWNGSAIGATYGGTGITSYAVGDLLYADTTTSLAKLADVATGNVLLSGGVDTAPSWGKVELGTHTTGNYVSTITGTTNQITASASTGDVTLSIPSDFRAPGTVNAVNGLYTGATAGTQRIDASGNLVNIVDISASGYATVSGSIAVGNTTAVGGPGNISASGTIAGVAITQNGNTVCDTSGNCSAVGNYWQLNSHVLSPSNHTDYDLAIGGTSTSSAKFQVLAANGNIKSTGTASISGTLTLGNGTTNAIQSAYGPLTLNYKSGADAYTAGLSLTNSGNVGIGTETPGYKLEVSGTGRFTGELSLYRAGFSASGSGNDQYQSDSSTGKIFTTRNTGAGYPFLESGNFIIQSQSTRDIVLGSSGGTRMVIDRNGYVGIGSTSPTAKLDIVGDASTSASLVFRGTTPTIDILNNKTLTFQSSPGGDGGLTSIATLDPSGNLTTGGNIDINGTANDIAGTLNLSGDTLTSSTDLTIDPTGGGVKIGTGTPGTVDLAGDDLYVTGDLEAAGSIYQGANQVCDTSGNCASVGNYWRLSNNVLSPVQVAYDLTVGGDATGSAFQVYAATGNVSLGDLEIKGGNINPTAALTIGDGGDTLTIDSSDWDINSTGDMTNIGNISADGTIAFTGTTIGLGTSNSVTTFNVGTGTAGNTFNIATNNTTKDTVNIGSALDDVIINGAGTGSTINFANFDVATTGNVTVQGNYGIDTNAAGILKVGDTTATTVSVGSTAATTLNLGAGGTLTRAINIGTGTGVDTISIGTGGTGADVIGIGSANAGNVTVQSGAALALSGSTGSYLTFPNFAVDTNGIITKIDNVAHTIDDISGDLRLTSAGGQVYFGTDNDLIPTLGAGDADLGSDAARWDNLFATQICLSGDCKTAWPAGSAGYWRQTGEIIAPTQVAYDVVVGGFATGSGTFQVYAGTGDIVTSGDLAVNGDNITADGSLGILGATGASLQATTGTVTIDSIAASQTLNIGASNVARTINIGTGTGVDTISIGTGGTGADVISIGSANAGNVTVQSNAALALAGSAGSYLTFPNFAVDTNGIITKIDNVAHTIDDVSGNLTLTSNSSAVMIADDLGVNGATSADITTTTTTATVFNSTATTLSIGGGATTAFNLGTGNSAYTAINLGTGTGGNVFNIGTNNTTKDTINIGSALDDVIINGAGTGSLINFANFDVATTGNITVQGNYGIDTNAAGTLKVGDATATTVDIGSTAATTLNLGAGGALTRAINIGTGTGVDTISIGTGGTGADVISIGSANAGNVTVQSNAALALAGSTGSYLTFPNFAVDTNGIITKIDNVAHTIDDVSGDLRLTSAGGQVYFGTDNDLIPTLGAGDADIGASGTPWDNIYGTVIYQAGNQVCDDSGNCGGGGQWTLNATDGTLYPNSQTADVLIGGNSTASAKFRVIPSSGNITAAGTASISGTLTLGNGSALQSAFGPVTLNYKSGANAWTAGLSLTNSGYVGIGTATPTQKLDVNGYVRGQRFEDTSSASYYIDPASTSTAVSIAGDIVSDDSSFSISSTSNQNITINAGSGTVVIGDGTGKLDAGTIDPPYTINGGKFATYQASMTGIKEETTGTTTTSQYVAGQGYRSVLDFSVAPEGSDLWLFSKTTNLSQNFDKMVVLLSPSSNTKAWYTTDPSGKLYVYTSEPTTVSYRLTAPRFDSDSWLNTRTSDSLGFVINDENLWPANTSTGSAIAQVDLGNFDIQATTSTESGRAYDLVNKTTGNIVEEIAALSEAVIANIKAGAIVTKDFTTNSFVAFQGTVDNLLVKSGLVAANIQTDLISPLPDQTDVTIKIGSESTPSGKLAIEDISGNEVASIDSSGNATFSGTLYADKINSKSLDDIQAILDQVQVDQNLLAQASGWDITATSSANLDQLITADLYVTNQAAINSLSITNSLTVGADMVIGSSVDANQTITNSIDTLSSPLQIQSLAMAPVEIMAGLIKIDTLGNVQIAGNLAVGGKIESSGLTLKGSETPTQTNNLLSLQNSTGSDVVTINASGSANFANIATQGLTIAGATEATQSALIDGVITTNATAGSAVIPAGTSEITIKNGSVTNYTLVYVTPTSSTNNYVLYVKNKKAGEFVVGFTQPIDIDANFNWWVVQVQN